MTPKEKAEEIWNKFSVHSDYGFVSIKLMCLILAEEMISEYSIQVHGRGLVNAVTENNLMYWINVKNYINEKL